jgi:LPS O-antigen subunit length determinant protein (WzzB/FepE family)
VFLGNKLLPYIWFEIKHLIIHKRFHLYVLSAVSCNQGSGMYYQHIHAHYVLVMKFSESFMRKQMYVQQKNKFKKKTKNKSVYAAWQPDMQNIILVRSCNNIQAYLITNNKTNNLSITYSSQKNIYNIHYMFLPHKVTIRQNLN